MTDRLVTAVRRTVALVRGEQTVEDAAYTALMRLTALAAAQLQSSGMDPSVLDSRAPAWQNVIDTTVLPALHRVFTRSWNDGLHPALQPVTAAAQAIEFTPEPSPGLSLSNQAADLYLQTDARNRLVGVSDTVYGQIVTALREGRDARVETLLKDGTTAVSMGESIPQLSARIDALLSDSERWRNRATVIARTEAGAAHGAGYHAAASYTAGQLGYNDAAVAKEWLATGDTRTRPTHASASGQKVIGMATPFSVGAASLLHACDPAGPAGEVIQCRCTTLYHYPGDPDYPADAVAPHSSDVDPVTGLTSEPAYVDRILTDLKAGRLSPAQLREAVAGRAPLSQANANVALRHYEQHLADLATAEPLQFANVGEARAWADAHWGDATAWSGEELRAMKGYTGSRYGPINDLLRSYKGKRVNDEVRALDRVMATVRPTPNPITVYRGTSLRQLGITTTTGDVRELVGQEFIDHGYMSTSISNRGAFTGDVRLSIRVPAGSRGAWLSGGKGRDVISEVGAKENEILFARGSRLRVLGVRRVGDRWHVDAELLQD